MPWHRCCDEKIEVKIKGGVFVATKYLDEDEQYQGIDVEFLADDEDLQSASHPRVLFELNGNEIVARAWTDPNSEDCTQEINFACNFAKNSKTRKGA